MTIDKSLGPETQAAGAAAEPRSPQPDRSAAPTRRWSQDRQLDAGSIVLCGLLLGFAVAHIRLWLQQANLLTGFGAVLEPGVLVGLGAVLLETFQGSLFLFRRRDSGNRRSASVWAATTIGAWGFLLARPLGASYLWLASFVPGSLHQAATSVFGSDVLFGGQPLLGAYGLWQVMQLVGTILAIVSLSSLGRSFGLLAANRGVQIGGAYRVVRHPAYASYFIAQLAYLLQNLSIWNLGLLSIVVVAQVVRIHQEEAVLSRDTAYGLYCRKVRYRLIPGIY